VVFATNLKLSWWGTVFADDQMVAAVMDRVAPHGKFLQFHDESCRLMHALM
jgi:DNA replication protein DnaC